MMEYWNLGVLSSDLRNNIIPFSIIPLFQFSLPA